MSFFGKYTDEEIKELVTECFNTIEKTGVWNDESDVCLVAQNFMAVNKGYSVGNFLAELYREFAFRFSLHKSYEDYLRSNLHP